MNIDDVMRLTQIMLGLAFLQQSVEHLHRPKDEKILYILRIVLSCLLIVGVMSAWVLVMLMIVSLFILLRFNGPYNGGSDRMGLLILSCLTLANFTQTSFWPDFLHNANFWRDIAMGYLAVQLVLSYFISGWVKVVNPQWRTGRALRDVFAFSTYPVSEHLRKFSKHPQLLFIMSWCVMGFELIFPLALFNPYLLYAGLVIAATFHLANAFLFGLNRFFWIWLCAYPAILWFQETYF